VPFQLHISSLSHTANLADAFADEILPYISFSFHSAFYYVTCWTTILTSEWNIHPGIWTKVSVFSACMIRLSSQVVPMLIISCFEAILALRTGGAFSNPEGDLTSAIATT
jgi:hypothetical protein